MIFTGGLINSYTTTKSYLMDQTLIQKYSTVLIKGLIEKVISLKQLNHRVTKGQLREIFVSDILKSFLTNQFSIGSGIIINQKGEQSNQNDIIIYDNRIMPPFLNKFNIGIYPAESVVATIEVKSNLTKQELTKAELSAKKLVENIYSSSSSIYEEFSKYKPIRAVLGFYGNGITDLKDKAKGKTWLRSNINYLGFICLMDKYSWINMKSNGWVGCIVNETNEEVKRFLAVLLDNIRTLAEVKYQILSQYHKDWLGIYVRDQKIFQ